MKLKELFKVLSREKDSDRVVIRKQIKTIYQGIDKCPRSSRFRGVSKNGAKWQVSRDSNSLISTLHVNRFETSTII